MPLDNGKVMVSWLLAEEILTLNLNAPTLRLVFSMLHQLDLAEVCGPRGPEECPVIWASSKDLRKRVGPKGSKCAREVRAAATSLIEAGVLVHATLLHNASKLQWQFSTWVWHHMRERDSSNFVLIDLSELGRFRSTFLINIYLVAQKVRGSAAPEFFVPFDDRISEEANIRRLLSALKHVSHRLNVVCYIALEMRLDFPEPAHFKVRMTHSETLWRNEGYMKFKRPKTVWRVDRSGQERFCPDMARRKRADRMAAADQGLDHQVDSVL